MGAEVAVRGDVARAEARLERGLIRAAAAARGADQHCPASTGRLATGRSERRDFGDEIVAQAHLAAELVGDAYPRLFLEGDARTEWDPAIGEARR